MLCFAPTTALSTATSAAFDGTSSKLCSHLLRAPRRISSSSIPIAQPHPCSTSSWTTAMDTLIPLGTFGTLLQMRLSRRWSTSSESRSSDCHHLLSPSSACHHLHPLDCQHRPFLDSSRTVLYPMNLPELQRRSTVLVSRSIGTSMRDRGKLPSCATRRRRLGRLSRDMSSSPFVMISVEPLSAPSSAHHAPCPTRPDCFLHLLFAGPLSGCLHLMASSLVPVPSRYGAHQ
jgi:hypothetical protein